MSAGAGSRSRTAFHFIDELISFHRPCDPEVKARLRKRFVHPICVFSADMNMLSDCGLDRDGALLISQIPALARRCGMSGFERRPLLADCASACAYLREHYYCLTAERFYLLCLDAHGRLMGLPLLQEGTDSGTLFSLRALLRTVLDIHPHAVVLSHNHPGGTLHPSDDDIQCTRAAMQALGTIGIPVLDHLILTRSEALSLRRNGFIAEYLWLQQAPDSRLMKGWHGADGE